jgi:segregation and condensation protein B
VKENLTRIVEALLFASDGPLKVEQVQEVLPAAKPEAILESIEELKNIYEENQRAFMIVPLAGGFQLLTRPDVSQWVEKFLIGRRRKRLSRAALEVLAVVAYQQPITRGDVESVRGVDCGGVFRTLLEREMIDVRGRAKTAGNPLLYVTTDKFLEHFGVESLKDLPKLDEFKALVDRDEAKEELQRAGKIATEPAIESSESAETDSDTTEDTDLNNATAMDDTSVEGIDPEEEPTTCEMTDAEIDESSEPVDEIEKQRHESIDDEVGV